MCRLCRPAGVNAGPTAPLHVQEIVASDLPNGRLGLIVGEELKPEIVQLLDSGYAVDDDEMLPPHTNGPVLWELHRSDRDKMVVETKPFIPRTVFCCI